MSIIAKAVVFILFILSAWSLGVMIDRALMYSAARKQSRVFVQQVAGALREGKLDEAISIAERNKKSHIAKVVATGLSEFQSASAQVSEAEVVEAAKRGLDRSIAIVHADMKRGLSGLATIGSTAPFVGLVRHGGRHHQRVQGHRSGEGHRAFGCGGRYFRSVGDHGSRPARGRARGLGLQLLHQQSGSLRRGDGQLLDGVDQLLHHAAKRKEVSHGAFQTQSSAGDGGPEHYSHGRHHAGPADHLHGGHAHVAEGHDAWRWPRSPIPMDMPNADRDDAIIVGISRDGSIFLGNQKTPLDQIASLVRDRISNRVDKTVFIKSDGRAKYGDVVKLVDEVRSAGVDNVGLLTDKTEQQHAGRASAPSAGLDRGSAEAGSRPKRRSRETQSAATARGVTKMGMEVGAKKGAMASMNVVPLIDILLVLLIIFMVITPLTPKGLDALVPQPAPPNHAKPEEYRGEDHRRAGARQQSS